MNKQSSVQWLFQKLWDTPKDKFEWQSIFLMAYEMHKEEIVDAYDDGWHHNNEDHYNPIKYYTKTFGGQDNE